MGPSDQGPKHLGTCARGGRIWSAGCCGTGTRARHCTSGGRADRTDDRPPQRGRHRRRPMIASLTRRSTIAALAAGGLLLLGLGSAALAAPSAATVPVTVKEFAVQPAAANPAAGQVTFQVANQGTVAHEMVVIRTDKPV